MRVTHPLDRQTGCVLSKKVKVPAGKKTVLRVVVGHSAKGDFDLVVRADGQELLRKAVSKKTTTNEPWLMQEVALSAFAGKSVKFELVNQPTGWAYEAAYWVEIAIVSQ